MNDEAVPVTVHILDKEYRIACPEEEREALLESARYLNQRMREIRDRGKVVGMDRIAVIAALNITHELLQYKHQNEDLNHSLGSRIRALREKIEVALNSGGQMEF